MKEFWTVIERELDGNRCATTFYVKLYPKGETEEVLHPIPYQTKEACERTIATMPVGKAVNLGIVRLNPDHESIEFPVQFTGVTEAGSNPFSKTAPKKPVEKKE